MGTWNELNRSVFELGYNCYPFRVETREILIYNLIGRGHIILEEVNTPLERHFPASPTHVAN